MDRVALIVNGTAVQVAAGGETPLLDVLRNHLGLTGARYGCGAEQCGACAVLIDGEPAYSCAKPLWALAGKRIVTVEGLGGRHAPHPVQQAILDEQAGQCGYCLSGIAGAQSGSVACRYRGGARRAFVPLRRA